MKSLKNTHRNIRIFIASISLALLLSPSMVSACPDLASMGSGGGEQCLINTYVKPAVETASALVGILVVISIIVAGIQYSSAAGDSSKVSAAKDRIRNSLVGFLAFLLLLAFLNWLIPGGV